MKVLGKAIYGVFLIFIGFQLYSCSSRGAYNRAMMSEGDKAFESNDYSLFKGIFEYHKEDSYIEKSIVLEDKDTRYDITNKDISFDIYVYLQSEKGKNHFTILLTNLEMEEPNNTLDVTIKKDGGKSVLEKQLVQLTKENWYLQYFDFDTDVFDQLIISHKGPSNVEPIILYDSKDEMEVFLNNDIHNMSEIIKEGTSLSENNIVKRESDPFKGKGLSVILTLLVYLFVAGLVTYVLYFQKPKVNQGFKKEEPAEVIDAVEVEVVEDKEEE